MTSDEKKTLLMAAGILAGLGKEDLSSKITSVVNQHSSWGR